MSPKKLFAVGAFALAAVVAACSDTSSPTGPMPVAENGRPFFAVGGPTPGVVDSGEFEICKHGTAATFTYSVASGPVQSVTLADGGCAVLANTETLGAGTISVTATEAADPTVVLDSIVATLNTIRNPVGVRQAPITGTNTYAGIFNGDRGTLVEFYNSPVPPQPASLGDFVWNDLNRDGIQNALEPGLAAVAVNLYDCSNNLLTSTSTNGSGNYLFGGLSAGCYVVGFVAPGGYVFSPAGQGGNPNLDSDANTTTGKTGQITLVAGQNDLTWDAGVNVPLPPPPPPSCTFTQGYWKNHTNVWPAPYSPNATFYVSGQTWLGVLNTPVKGNAYYILAYQFIAATLNGTGGAPANVQQTMVAAAAYFANPGGSTLTKTQLTTMGGLLDDYNNGKLGTPHCP